MLTIFDCLIFLSYDVIASERYWEEWREASCILTVEEIFEINFVEEFLCRIYDEATDSNISILGSKMEGSIFVTILVAQNVPSIYSSFNAQVRFLKYFKVAVRSCIEEINALFIEVSSSLVRLDWLLSTLSCTVGLNLILFKSCRWHLKKSLN